MDTATNIGTLSPVGIKDVFPGEASHFSPWLAEHAELLGTELGLELEHEDSEAKVGRYSADLVFRETEGGIVVVENMFGKTDHDHLGKLITYAAGFEACCAVLLATEFTDEHRSALNWLNHVSKEDFAFFGVVLEAWRIGDSPPAPRLRVEVKPDEWSRYVRAARMPEPSPRRQAYRTFWSEFLPAFREADPSWRWRRTPSNDSWMGFPSGNSQCPYHATFCQPDGEYRLRVEVYIDGGDKQTNKETFDKLHEHKDRIEQELGEPLEWDRLDDRQASRVSLYFPGGMEIIDKDRWSEAKDWLVEAMGRMRDAFGPAIQDL